MGGSISYLRHLTIGELAGWLAFALNVWGNLALTKKGTRGWIIRLGANAGWIPYGVVTSAWALTVNHAVFAVINGYGWWKWARDEKLDARLATPGESVRMDEKNQEALRAYVRGFEAGKAAR